MQSKDNFSAQAAVYARYRPGYPAELYAFILEHTKGREMALDCGTGNGQAALVLADHFKEVYAIDSSEKQIAQAPQKESVHYSVCPAEKTGFAENQFDLITVAQALHWFPFDAFFAEMKRVARPGALFAAWTYATPYIINDDVLNDQLQTFYKNKMGPYWDPERRHVDAKYQSIPFPFREISCPAFSLSFDWKPQDLEGYLNTWSSVQHYIKQQGENPVTAFIASLSLPAQHLIQIRFPVTMRAGFVEK